MFDKSQIEIIEDIIAAAVDSGETEKVKEIINKHPEIIESTIYCPPFKGMALSVLIHLAARSNNLELAKIALKYGADIESFCSTPPGHDTPLETASSHDSIDVVCFLIENGANINGRPENTTSPLLSALSKARNNEQTQRSDEIVRLLIENGADVNRLHLNMHLTPLDICRMWGRKEIESFLIEHGAIGEPREPVDWDSIPGAGILLHVENHAGHVLPVKIHSPNTNKDIDLRQAIINKKFRLLFTHGLFKKTHPHIELYSLLPLRWPINKDAVQSNSPYSFPVLAMTKLIGAAETLKHGHFVERNTKNWESLQWPCGVEGLALVNHKWPRGSNSTDQDDDGDNNEDTVSLLLVQPLSSRALQQIKSNKYVEWFEKAKNNKWHQVVYPEI